MNSAFVIGAALFVLIIFLTGIFYTFKEFNTMMDDPEKYRPEPYREKERTEPEVVDEESK
jgi:hypothetical protein